ncbi:DNA topoisomerase I, partial [Candidatus Woesearchaeota archaeon]|nr:DNA topoisomerase I [Candidatus Woesearchaeota archaeon]
MAYELIISEKPQASKRIADALADAKPKKELHNKVPHYILTHNGKEIVIACAVGHLYGLAQVKDKKKKKGWTYPVFDVEWKPISEIQKKGSFSKKYLDNIKKLAKNAGSFTVATDFDVEGEVIGLNCIRFICKQKDANRMKFSTLTKEDLIESYEHKLKHLEWGQARAGETRHILDWFWGINLSRALTLAVNKARGGFKLLTAGRVQGPALKLIVDKEKEIRAFVAEPYWELQLLGEKNKQQIEAMHTNGRFTDEKAVKKIFDKIKGCKSAIVESAVKKRVKEAPPFPFDLTTLQTQSARYFKMGPKATLNIAQNLYTNGYISYPRTSSQKLPAKLGYKKILNKLGKNPKYEKLASGILDLPQLKPNEGPKTDDAHPSIFPTGIIPKRLNDAEAKIYDLIVKRFLAIFAPPAVREQMKVIFDVKDEKFSAEGSRTVEENWYKYYAPYLKRKEIELPKLKEKDVV